MSYTAPESSNPFSVLTGEIQAAMLFASGDEERFVLSGVLFEFGKNAKPLLVATDGRRLAVIESSAEIESETISGELILASAFLKPFCAFAKSQSVSVNIDLYPPKRVCLGMKDAKLWVDSEEGAVIEGDFPKWRSVIPKGVKSPVSQISFQAAYLADFHKAAKLLGCEAPVIEMYLNESGAVEVRIVGKPNFYGIVMPMKSEEPKTHWQPEFLGLNVK